jgi:hypothetical protein
LRVGAEIGRPRAQDQVVNLRSGDGVDQVPASRRFLSLVAGCDVREDGDTGAEGSAEARAIFETAGDCFKPGSPLEV